MKKRYYIDKIADFAGSGLAGPLIVAYIAGSL